MPANLVIPTIGDAGYYSLKSPFDKLISENTVYTCQAIRRIGDYLAYNEDPLNDIYIANGLSQSDFDTDQASNMYIVSLQSETGQWVYVPASYILTYPITNGIPYQNFMIGVALGALPSNVDLTALQTLIGNVVYENFGIQPKMSPVALSKPVLVERSKHDNIQRARILRATEKKTDFGRYQEVLTNYLRAMDQIAKLEAFIKERYLENIIMGPPM